MRMLILGGTSFVGRHITEEAVKRGHEVVLFNRGKSQPHAFPELARIIGDRRKDAEKLSAEQWDAVIDTSAYSPADLRPVFPHLKTAQYLFISTISVYSDFSKGPVSEQAALYTDRPTGDAVTGETYGPLKVMCEETVREQFGDSALILRPGIVIGPHDPTDRFTYWALRLAEPGPVLIPGSERRKVQWIDARDLAAFAVSQLEQKATGVFNVTADAMTMDQFVDAVKTEGSEPVWVPDEELIQAGIQPFEIPLWIPESPDYPEGFLLTDNSRAKAAGLAFRPVSESAEDTRAWHREEGRGELKAGISRKREEKLLRAANRYS